MADAAAGRVPMATCSCSALQLWGGVECTVNRVGSRYFDQLAFNGHERREDDLDRFAELGIEALRYPVLWERMAPGRGPIDWTWADRRLNRIRRLKLTPIVGLVHHGSGPRHTALTSSNFAPLLAAYAAQVARRYPWVCDYTPVNEPLTTARFSGLYGHWYPHQCHGAAFARALIHQCQATVLAMQAIRRINPRARLVQTEDLGLVHSTPLLAGQAEFENHRRWLTLDLLCGRVGPSHVMHEHLVESGVAPDELRWLVDNACPPDVIGCNYYLTSERFLDERLERYPSWSHGGNGRQRYADVEAVRVRGEGLAGLRVLLEQVWRRYGLPMAITEVHLGCRRESQIRWLVDAWDTAQALRSSGTDVRAVTAWALLGSFEWNSLVTRRSGHYEPGAFDVRSTTPRATALARALRGLRRSTPQHPAVPELGWWRTPGRLCYPPVFTGGSTPCPLTATPDGPSRPPILIAGAGGTLGQAFAHVCRERQLPHVAMTRAALDITDRASIAQTLRAQRPWAVINAAGYVQVDSAENDARLCRRANAAGAVNLARACADQGIALLTFSTDLVFDGASDRPYVERDSVRPLCVYGHTKAEAERRVIRLCPRALVVRTSAFFGPWDHYNFLAVCFQRITAGLPVRAAEDWVVSPTYVPDLVHACLDLLIDEEAGLWHLANEGATSWADFARAAASAAGLDHHRVEGCPGHELRLPAARPRFSVLGSERGLLLPPLEDGIQRYCRAWRCAPRQPLEPQPVAAGA